MSDFVFDPANPLAKMPGETQRANDALRDYYAMGPGRSLTNLLESYRNQEATKPPPTKRLDSLKGWSTKFAWVARVEAQRALDLESDKLLWDERRRQIRESDWAQGLALRDLANKVMAEGVNFIKTRRRLVKGSPKVVDPTGRVLDPGTPDQVVVTMALDGGFLVKAATTGSELTRLAADMASTRQAVDLDLAGSVTLKQEVDYADLTDNQLKRLANDTAKLLMALSTGVDSESGSESGPDSDSQPVDQGPADS